MPKTETWNLFNRRRRNRADINKPFRTEEGEGINEQLLNLSEKGCCIATPIIFRKGDPITVDLERLGRDLPSAQKVRMGRIVWEKLDQGRLGVYGIRFED